jgi:hypothetical protein
MRRCMQSRRFLARLLMVELPLILRCSGSGLALPLRCGRHGRVLQETLPGPRLYSAPRSGILEAPLPLSSLMARSSSPAARRQSDVDALPGRLFAPVRWRSLCLGASTPPRPPTTAARRPSSASRLQTDGARARPAPDSQPSELPHVRERGRCVSQQIRVERPPPSPCHRPRACAVRVAVAWLGGRSAAAATAGIRAHSQPAATNDTTRNTHRQAAQTQTQTGRAATSGGGPADSRGMARWLRRRPNFERVLQANQHSRQATWLLYSQVKA